jgi:3-oxoacyl-[acyl-carrier protein] reductase
VDELSDDLAAVRARPSRDLEGRAVLVTGGSRGIGRAIVLGALARGADVAYCSRDGSQDASVAGAARAFPHGRLVAVRADVSREADVEAFFDAALAALGRVDAVINNAAISREDLLVSCLAETWDALIATNLTGAFLVSRRALREFRGRGGGRLVFMGSLQQYGAPRGAAAYAAAKGGLTGLVQAVAWEHGQAGIRANQVAPGYVETGMTSHLESARRRFLEECPLRRLPTLEEIASVVLFLASDRSAGINGQTLHAAGGIMETFR